MTMTPGLKRLTAGCTAPATALHTTPAPAATARPPAGADTVAAGVARAWLDLACARGADRSALLAQAGLYAADLADLDQRVPWTRLCALVQAARSLSGDPALGLRFGEMVDCADYSVVALMSRACATVGEAIAQRNRYGRLIGEFGDQPGDALALEFCGRQVWLVATRHAAQTMPEMIEAFFSRVAWGTRQMGAIDMLKAAHFSHAAPPYLAEYQRVFPVPLVFGAERNALLLDAAWLDLRIAQVPGYAFGILSAHAEALMCRLQSARGLRGEVERLLLPMLHTGEAGASRIAERLGISRQTLFRRLKAEGTSFAQTLDELRHRLAWDYLEARKVSVHETAYLLGFSDPAAFSRAFKRWTGRSPAQRACRPDPPFSMPLRTKTPAAPP